jgi:hypothetical protein
MLRDSAHDPIAAIGSSRIPQRINAHFAVRIRLNDGENLRLPAGTQGSTAGFTGNV